MTSSFVETTPARRLDYSGSFSRSISRLSPSNEQTVSSGLKRIIDSDVKTENARSQLVLRTDFNL